jgi:thiamine kinase-like enzyme
LPAEIDDLMADARLLALRIEGFRPALCHNDLLPANLISSGEQLWLIDWEYGGVGHPLFDLASVSAGAAFTECQDRALLEAYRGELRADDLHKLRIFRAASSLREALWALVQSVDSRLSFDYLAYADVNIHEFRRACAKIVP